MLRFRIDTQDKRTFFVYADSEEQALTKLAREQPCSIPAQIRLSSLDEEPYSYYFDPHSSQAAKRRTATLSRPTSGKVAER